MAAEQRKLLEQLMGQNLLNGPSESKPERLSITDPKLCRSYIVGTCPHDLFTNTKHDIGPCTKSHSEQHKSEYENATPEERRRWAFEFDYFRDMDKYVSDCNRRIETAQRRLDKTPEEIRQTNTLLKSIEDLRESLTAGMQEIELLASLGHVQAALPQFYSLQRLKVQKDERERELKSLADTGGPSGHQKLQVCDVCGAYLSRLDNDRRLADHFFGKMHLGYAQMRKTWEVVQKELRNRPPPLKEDVPGARMEYDGGGYGRGGGFRGGGGYGGGGYGGGGYGRGGYRGGRGGYAPRW